MCHTHAHVVSRTHKLLLSRFDGQGAGSTQSTWSDAPIVILDCPIAWPKPLYCHRIAILPAVCRLREWQEQRIVPRSSGISKSCCANESLFNDHGATPYSCAYFRKSMNVRPPDSSIANRLTCARPRSYAAVAFRQSRVVFSM